MVAIFTGNSEKLIRMSKLLDKLLKKELALLLGSIHYLPRGGGGGGYGDFEGGRGEVIIS